MTAAAFPSGFVWGTATAAHQVEGGNVGSDCWALEHARPSFFAEPSGDAVDQLHRFGDDIGLVAALGLKAYRFSVEWARIEPEEGAVSQAALGHYQRVIEACRERGVEPVITLHHFTSPRWVARRGGFHDPSFPGLFARYAETVARALEVDTVCTINEINLPPMVFAAIRKRATPEQVAAAEQALGGPLHGFFLFADREALASNGVAAHKAARDAFKAVRPRAKVGITLAMSHEQAEPGAEAHRDARRELAYRPFLEAARGDDFIGVQTYTRTVHRPDGSTGPPAGARLSTMGYEDWPPAVAEVCRWVWDEIRTPILITESGIAGEDERRAQYIPEVLQAVHAAIADGVDIRAYFYWSLLDNFEWLFGYAQRFGLVAVDRATQQRTPKPSAEVFGRIARRNGLSL